uniref:RNA-binding region-containing protein 3 n=1 Tax=Periophthalmus magnuspinnatus TaxID=409849 RepID=A0A3B4ABB6_9GOBI
METTEENPKSNVSKTLLVRQLPPELSKEEKEDLLQHFGAESVRVCASRGRMKNAAFATFRTERFAAKALVRLHQLQVLGQTLVVEFAKGQDSVVSLKDPPVTKIRDKTPTEQKRPEPKPSIPFSEDSLAPSLGLKFQANPILKYLYPPPSNATLANITHALISVPKFYVQVLHLMNKMHLPCPFGPVTVRPPTYEVLAPAPPVPPPENPPLPRQDGSSEESEYESEDDDVKERIARVMGLVNQACKRPLRQKASSERKKPRIKSLLFAPKAESQSAPALQPSDVFEQPHPTGHKKIEFHISVSETKVESSGPGTVSEKLPLAPDVEAPPSTQGAAEVLEGFGKLFPSAQPSETQEDDDDSEDEDVPKDVISRKELERGRLSRDEIKRISVFKNYEPGEPTCRLYVKNISKHVEEKDLKYIYGRYIDRSSEAERNMFDVVLMKEGRMKGQAFVGLPSEASAQRALRDTHGYVLHDKPLVVQFARSAKPKDGGGGDTKRRPR